LERGDVIQELITSTEKLGVTNCDYLSYAMYEYTLYLYSAITRRLTYAPNERNKFNTIIGMVTAPWHFSWDVARIPQAYIYIRNEGAIHQDIGFPLLTILSSGATLTSREGFSALRFRLPPSGPPVAL
jgi:hypothetical protein